MTFTAGGQTTRFDLVTFKPPKGWKKTMGKEACQYAIFSADKKRYCLIGIYKSIPAGNDPDVNFNNSWQALVKEAMGVDATPEKQPPAVENGWTAVSGYASFTGKELSGLALLVSSSGYNRVCNILMVTNTQEFQEAADAFLSSVSFSQPPAGTEVSPPTNPPVRDNTAPAANVNGIAKASTQFSDGWTAFVQPDYVEVKKGELRVLVHYGITITDDVRNQNEQIFTQYYWDRVAAGRYQSATLMIRRMGMYDFERTYYGETTAVEKATGKTVFVAFRITNATGVAYATECIAPNEAAYRQAFPTDEALPAMRNSNRFAISATDITGDWTSSSTSAMQLYNVYTGQSAGMQYAAGADEFTFKPGGTYNSRHRGGYGNMSGNQTFYDTKYNGSLKLSDWELTLTNRFNGKTEVFLAHYEAVKGGRILHLVNKQSPGLKYALYKVK